MRWLERQRERLEAMLAHHERRGEAVARHLRREGGLDRDSQERAQELEGDDVLAALAVEGQGQVALIRAALDRLDQDQYGLCAGCGKQIPRARLDAVPYAATCVDCARQAERAER